MYVLLKPSVRHSEFGGVCGFIKALGVSSIPSLKKYSTKLNCKGLVWNQHVASILGKIVSVVNKNLIRPIILYLYSIQLSERENEHRN